MIDAPFFEERHTQLAEAVDRFAQEYDLPGIENDDEEHAARELVGWLADARFLAYSVPRDFESTALDVRALCVVREHLSYHSSMADLMFAMQGLGSYPITLAGSEETRRRFLPRVRAGGAIAAFAITEPGAGSDVSAVETVARRDGDEYVLDGGKTFISNAGLADFYTVFARTGSEPGHRGLSAFVVEADAKGFHFEGPLALIAPHPIGRLRFEGCRVPAKNRLGAEGDGFKIAMATLDTFRPTVGAAALGLAWRALDEAVGYAKRRVQFGKPLAEFQATQLKLAEMATALDAARLLVYRAAWKKDSGAARITREAAMAKMFATESAQEIIDQAVQIHGGAGVLRGAVVERLYREVRALRIYEGTTEIQKLIIAGQLLGAR